MHIADLMHEVYCLQNLFPDCFHLRSFQLSFAREAQKILVEIFQHDSWLIHGLIDQLTNELCPPKSFDCRALLSGKGVRQSFYHIILVVLVTTTFY